MTQKRKEQLNFLGQHLLHNKKIIAQIVDQAQLTKRDTVLELGAGKGALTTTLCQTAEQVIAVEIDDQFVEILKSKLAPYRNAKVIRQNILNIRLPRNPFVVVSNIPYAITTPIMRMLLEPPASRLQKGVIMMEKGAAKRFTSTEIKDEYVITWRMYFDLCFVRTVSRYNFDPPPKVDSAILKIQRKKKPLIGAKDYRTFLALAKYLLKSPRTRLHIALRGIFKPHQIGRIERSLKVPLDETQVSSLSEEQWGEIYNAMVKHVPKLRWPK